MISRLAASMVLGHAAFLIAAATMAAEPPPASPIRTATGRTVILYDGTEGYLAKPYRGGLRDRGFQPVIGWNGTNIAGVSRPPAWNSTVPPEYGLRDGSLDQRYVDANADALCAMMAPAPVTLVYLDLEWLLIDGVGPYSPHELNVSNLGTVLRWVRARLQAGPCRDRFRLAAYGVPPANAFELFYTGTPGPHADSWRSAVQSVIAQLAPELDVLTPSLYAVYSAFEEGPGPCGSPGYQRSHVVGWTNFAREVLTEAREGARSHSLAVAPFIGLRYYFVDGGTCARDPHLNRYVEAPFFRAMLSLVTDPAYGCEGVVYWDFGAFGGPGLSGGIPNADDGTDVWSNDHPWVTTTFSFFEAPEATFSRAFTDIIDQMLHDP
jgi:hypothetical protein